MLPGGAGDHGEAGNSTGGTHGGTGGGDTERRGAPIGAAGARSPQAEGGRPTSGGANCKVGQSPKGSGGFLPDWGAVNGARGAAAVGRAWRRCSHCTSRRVWRSGRPILHVEWGGGQPTGHAGTGPTDEGLNEDGGDGSPPPDGRQEEETVTPIPSPMPADDPEETESVGGVDHDMEEGDTQKPHKRSQSLPGGGRSKRGRSPAKRAEKPTRDIHKVKADAKGKKGKAGEARQGV